MRSPPLGSLLFERVSLTALLAAPTYITAFLIVSRLGLIHGRDALAFAAAVVLAWAFWRWVLPPQMPGQRLDGDTIFACLVVVGSTAAALFAVAAPSYLLTGYDPLIVPNLADTLLSHATTMDAYQPGDPGYTYPPGYPILFSVVSHLLPPLETLSVFKGVTILLIALVPVGWAWLTWRVFEVPLPFWLVLLLAYMAVFGFERTVTFTLEHGKNSQVLAGAMFPFLVGLLLITARKNIGLPFAIVAVAGGILVHFSMIYLLATFFVAYFVVCFPRNRQDWLAFLRLCVAGILSLGAFILLLPEVLHDPRAGSVGWLGPVGIATHLADVLFEKYDSLLFIFNGPYPTLQSPYRGAFLLGCILLPFVIALLLREPRDRRFVVARAACIWGIMWLIGILFGSNAIQAGITADLTRWYLFFPQLALILAALCAIACYACSNSSTARLASWSLAGIAVVAIFIFTSDLAWFAFVYRTQGVSRAQLVEVRNALSSTPPCFLVTQSTSIYRDLHVVQQHKPLDYAEFLTGCKVLNGSFLRRPVPEGRALQGLPTAAALSAVSANATVRLVAPEDIEASYRAALPSARFEREPGSIGALPIWRIHIRSQ